jgi:hypothetical protein
MSLRSGNASPESFIGLTAGGFDEAIMNIHDSCIHNPYQYRTIIDSLPTKTGFACV